MRYEPPLFRPPSEADAFILQATIGCSWNACVYCDMYRSKSYRERPVSDCLDDVSEAAAVAADSIEKVFVADGDALGMPMATWRPILTKVQQSLPKVRRVSCYAMARNVLAKTDEELSQLAQLGLTRLYIGPETGDDVTAKRIAKGATFDQHVAAAQRAHAAGMSTSVIVLLGVGGTERSAEHAAATGALLTAMDPEYCAALTTTVVPGTPLARLEERGRFTIPDKPALLRELRTILATAAPTNAVFRTNHASNYLPLAGRLPRDTPRLLAVIDGALAGEVALRPEWSRGL